VERESRLIARFAVIGLLISVLVFLYLKFFGEFDSTVYTAFAILCPPALMCISLSEAMKEHSGFYGILFLIGVANSGLYAVVGAAFVGLRKAPRTKTD
jgi:hypothetical protein